MTLHLRRRPKGGYLTHLIPPGSNKALCGYEPGESGRGHGLIVGRHGWTFRQGIRVCQGCQDRLPGEQPAGKEGHHAG